LGEKKDDSNDTKLNSKLLAVLNSSAVPDGNKDPTGLKDHESDVEVSRSDRIFTDRSLIFLLV
jgi:hypothetical protein